MCLRVSGYRHVREHTHTDTQTHTCTHIHKQPPADRERRPCCLDTHTHTHKKCITQTYRHSHTHKHTHTHIHTHTVDHLRTRGQAILDAADVAELQAAHHTTTHTANTSELAAGGATDALSGLPAAARHSADAPAAAATVAAMTAGGGEGGGVGGAAGVEAVARVVNAREVLRQGLLLARKAEVCVCVCVCVCARGVLWVWRRLRAWLMLVRC
jgi:hypothetical protein